MPLSPRKLGRLELVAEIHTGGRGEFFRARDTRNGRQVGVHILPFVRGAPMHFEPRHHRAAQLNHPNILGIRGLRGKTDISYLVTELVDGETLAMLLKRGPVAITEAVDYADQIVRALEAAHAHNVIHGALGPGYILVDAAGNVKVFGFGVAIEGPLDDEDLNECLSPEAVLGKPLDARSDIFSFGSTLQEMLSGEAPFRRRTRAETAHAIIEDWPQPLPDKVPDDLAFLVARCLAKNPAQRFQTVAELKAALQDLVVQGLSDPVADLSPSERLLQGWAHVARTHLGRGTQGVAQEVDRLTRVPLRWTILVLASLALLVAADLFLRMHAPGTAPPPTFQRLTFRQGPILRARFAQHAQSVAYTAQFDGTPQTSYLMNTATGLERELKLPPESFLVSVSSQGDAAIRLADGSLARLPLEGSGLVNQATAVLDADFSPRGDTLAVARLSAATSNYVLEYPLGQVLVQSNTPIELVRISPRGDSVAFAKVDGAEKRLWVVNRAGHSTMLAGLGKGEATRSLSWSNDGSEIWFGATDEKERGIIQAVSLEGKRRTVAWMPETQLDDVGPDGQALVEVFRGWKGARVGATSQDRETDLSWFGQTVNLSLAADGSRLFLTEQDSAGSSVSGVYVRSLLGTPPRRLGDGSLVGVSPDGRWASVYRPLPQPRYYLVRSDGAQEKPVVISALEGQTAAVLSWMSAGRYLVWGNLPGLARQHFVWDPASGAVRPVSPTGTSLGLSSEDGTHVLASRSNNSYYVFPTQGGEPTPARGLLSADQLLNWTKDGNSIYVGTVAANGHDFSIFEVNLDTGARTLSKVVQPDIPTAKVIPAAITPGGSAYAYLYFRAHSELFLAHGLQ